MKQLLICLLSAALLFTLAISVSADVVDIETDDAFTVEDTDNSVGDDGIADWLPGGDETEGESGSAGSIVIVPSEADLPEGYVPDSDFSIEFELSEENGWKTNLKDLLQGVEVDGYIYYLEEVDVPESYEPSYSSGNNRFTSGTYIVITNHAEGPPPEFQLPQSGGAGTVAYTIAAAAFFMAAAIYGMIVIHKGKKAQE